MVKYYFNIKDGFIDKFNGVKGVIGTTDTLDVEDLEGLEWIELSESQTERFEEGSNDLQYIITGVETPAPEPTLDELKQSKLNTLNANLQVELNKGFDFGGFKFALDNNTKDNISSWDLGIEKENKLCLNEGYERKRTSFQITDIVGIHRYITLAEWDLFFVEYFDKLATLKSHYSAKRNNVNNATTELVLDAVNIDFTNE